MARYSIQGIVAADTYLGEVEADSAEAAIEVAYETLDCGAPSVCHQCSHELNVGDVYRLVASGIGDNDRECYEEPDASDTTADKLREQLRALGIEPCA